MEKQMIKIIKESFTNLPYSLVLSGNVLAIIQKNLMNAGINSFPVITIYGESKAGKTSLFKACLLTEGNAYSAHGKTSKKLSEALEKKRGEFVLLDDFSETKCQRIKERYASIMDDIIRMSFEGSIALAGITIEEAIIDKTVSSCRNRMLCYHLPGNWIKGKKQFLNEINTNRAGLIEVFHQFSDWITHENINYSEIVNCIRDNHDEIDIRLNDMLGCYQQSVYLFNRFLKHKYDVSLDETKIKDNMIEIEQQNVSLDDEAIVCKIFDRVIKSGCIKYAVPVLGSFCKKYLDNSCGNRDASTYNDCEYYCREFENIECYNPLELIINPILFQGILITDSRKIYKFPYRERSIPLLIVPRNTFMSFFNNQLEMYANEKKVSIPFFTRQKLEQKLAEYNLCTFIEEAKTKRYSFPFKVRQENGIESTSVLILRVNDDLKRYILQNAVVNPMGMIKSFDEVKEISALIQRKWNQINYSCGEVGKKTEVQ